MLRSLYLKSVRDRWMGAGIGVLSLVAVALMGLWAYAGIGDQAVSFFAEMPAAYQTLLGITADSGVAGLLMSEMFNFMGPFVLAGIAVSMGAAAIAGEERDGTMNVLATVPRSRGRILWSKTAAMMTVVVAACAAVWLGYLAAVAITGLDAGTLDLVAASVHVAAVSMLFGAAALAVGAWTGRQTVASGAGTAFLVISFLGAGLLPLFDGWQNWAKIFPWYYIKASQPLINGVDWSHVALIAAFTAALLVLAWWGVGRRDLRDGATSVSILDRLRMNPALAKELEMLRGTASTRGVVTKSLSEARAVTIVAGGGLFVMLTILGPMFKAVSGFVGQFAQSFPPEMLAMVGFADYSRPEGWYHGEGLSIVAPVAVAVVTISMGMALAGEERRRTISTLLGNPISRSQVAWRRAFAMLLMGALVGVLAGAGIALGNLIAGLGIDYGNIAAAAALLGALGAVFGAAAFMAGALSGRTSVALGVGTGVAVLGWGVNAFVAINPARDFWAHLSPFYYYGSTFPLDSGMRWTHLLVLVVTAAVLLGVGAWGYVRRDLRG